MSSVASAKGIVFGLKTQFRDTIFNPDNSSTITNAFTLESKRSDSLRLRVRVSPDESWKSMGRQDLVIVVPPRGRRVLPVSLLRNSGSNAGGRWSSVTVRLHEPDGDTVEYAYVIQRPLIVRFSVSETERDVILSKETPRPGFNYRLKNEGSTAMVYKLHWTLNQLNLNKKKLVELAPGQDTVIHFEIDAPQSDLKMLNGDMLRLSIADDSSSKQIAQSLSYSGSAYTVNRSAYNTFPISVSVGMLARNDDLANLFVTTTGKLQFGKTSRLSWYYRSKDYILINRYQNNIFSLDFTSKHLNLYVGQVRTFNDFTVFGNEARVTAKWRTGDFALYGMKSFARSYYSDNQLGTTLRYQLFKARVEHSISARLDSTSYLTGGIFRSSVTLFNRADLNLNVFGALGADLNGPDGILSQLEQREPGISYGFQGYYQYKRLSLNSNHQRNSLYFPGIYRGLHSDNHSVGLRLSNTVGLSAFFSSNKTTNNFGIDTLLNSNRLQYNMQRYGVQSSITAKRLNIQTSIGMYENTALTFLPLYYFTEMRVSYKSARNLLVTFNTQDGIEKGIVAGRAPTWFTSTNFQVGSKYFGVSGNYFRNPRPSQIQGEQTINYNESLSLIASLRFQVRNQLFANLDYEVTRFALNNIITHNSLFHITYQGLRNGMSFNLDGSIPLQRTTQDNVTYLAGRNYAQATLTKQFSVPVVTRKLYYDLTLRLYFDENSNGIWDRDEKLIANSLVQIADRLYYTDGKGMAQCENAQPGKYSVDLTKVSGTSGYLPVNGYHEEVDLQRDMVINIGFRQGRRIRGQVKFKLDNFSTENYSPDGLKLTISDTSGAIIGHALTDHEGYFVYTVPAGVYTVSLNREAFNEKMVPLSFSEPADLLAREECEVLFQVQQKRREIRIKNRN